MAHTALEVDVGAIVTALKTRRPFGRTKAGISQPAVSSSGLIARATTIEQHRVVCAFRRGKSTALPRPPRLAGTRRAARLRSEG